MLETSKDLNEISKALAKAQSCIKNATRDKKGDKYKYADLSQIIEICREPLTSNDMCFLQPVSSDDNGDIVVSTLIVHSSGQWIKSSAKIPDAVLHGGAGKNPVQVKGSSITYMRRYQLAGMMSISQEDDDGKGYQSPPKVKINPLDPKIFEDKKHDMAQYAKSQGQGGIEKMIDMVKKKYSSFLTESQDEEIRNIIIDIAMKEKEVTESEGS